MRTPLRRMKSICCSRVFILWADHSRWANGLPKVSLRAGHGVEFALQLGAFLAPARGIVELHDALRRHGEAGAVRVARGSAELFDAAGGGAEVAPGLGLRVPLHEGRTGQGPGA